MPPSPPDRTSLPGGISPALLSGGLAVATVVASTLEPGLLTGDALLGAGTADTWGHAWGYGWTADALLDGRLPFEGAPVNHPAGQAWWVIDLPVAVLLAPVAHIFGTSLAYNVAMLLHVGIGAAATTALVRSRGGTLALSVLAGVLAVHAPFVRGVVTSGVPEALGVLLVPLLVLWLDRGLRSGAWRPLLGASLLSSVLVLDGVYGALAGALAAGIATGVAVWTGPQRARVATRAAAVATPAFGALLALRWGLHASEHPALFQGKTRTVMMGDAWILQPLGGSDLAAWVLPAAALPLAEPSTAHRHIVYVGLLLPLLIGWAAWRHRGARRPAAVALAGFVVALGPALFVYGLPLTPAVLPGTLIWLAGATNLYRLAGLVPVVGLVAVACALSASPARRWGGVALALVGLEWGLGAPLPAVLPTLADPAGDVEAWLADQPGDGAVLDLPFDREGTRARGPWPQRTFYLQSVHGRPIASGLYAASGMHTRHPALGAFDRSIRTAWQRRLRPDGHVDDGRTVRFPEPPRGRTELILSELVHASGFRHVVLDLELVVEEQRPLARAWVEAWLGPPAQLDPDALRLAWTIAEPDPSAAPPPERPRRRESRVDTPGGEPPPVRRPRRPPESRVDGGSPPP